MGTAIQLGESYDIILILVLHIVLPTHFTAQK